MNECQILTNCNSECTDCGVARCVGETIHNLGRSEAKGVTRRGSLGDGNRGNGIDGCGLSPRDGSARHAGCNKHGDVIWAVADDRSSVVGYGGYARIENCVSQ